MSSSIPSIVNNTNSTLSPSIANSSSSSTNNPQVALSNDVFGSVLRTTLNTTTSSSSSSTSSSSTTIPRSSIASSSLTAQNEFLTAMLKGVSRIPVGVIHSNGMPVEEMKSSTSNANIRVLGSLNIGECLSGLETNAAFIINNQRQLEMFGTEIRKPKKWTKQLSTSANLEENNLVFLYKEESGKTAYPNERAHYVSTTTQTNQSLNLTLVRIPENEFVRIPCSSPGGISISVTAREFIILSIPKTNTIQKICLVFEEHKKDHLDMERDLLEARRFNSNKAQIKEIVERLIKENKPLPFRMPNYNLLTWLELPNKYETWLTSLPSEDQLKIKQCIEDNCRQNKIQKVLDSRDDSMRLTAL